VVKAQQVDLERAQKLGFRAANLKLVPSDQPLLKNGKSRRSTQG